MASEVLTLDGDITALWTVSGGPLHYQTLLTDQAYQYVWTMIDDAVDMYSMTNPVGDIESLTKLTFTAVFRLVINNTAGWIGNNYQLYDGANLLGGYISQMVTNFTQHSIDYEFDLTGASVSDLRFKMTSEGSNWGFGQGIIQVAELQNMTLWYEEPASEIPPEYTCTSGIDSTGTGTSTGFMAGACTRGIDSTGSGTSTGYRTGSGASTGFKTGSGNSYIKEP